MATCGMKSSVKKMFAKAMREYEVWYKKWNRKMGGK